MYPLYRNQIGSMIIGVIIKIQLIFLQEINKLAKAEAEHQKNSKAFQQLLFFNKQKLN